MSERESKKMSLCFFICAAVFLGGVALVVYLADPFFHYHEPWFGLAAVQDEKEYQVPGGVEHLDYDSVLVGSSVTMSMNTDILNERFDCMTIKAVGNAAGAPVLNYYLNLAFESRDLKYVFYGLDVFSFYNDPDMNVVPEDVEYLINKNPLDDVQYLWNGEIIGRKIPDMIRISRCGNYTWGMVYNFNQYGVCGPDGVLAGYTPTSQDVVEQYPYDYQSDYVMENLERLENVVREHPETQFVFFVPPYPILWWDRAYSQGTLSTYEYTLKETLKCLLAYENVDIYTTHFNDATLITDMYQYMDIIHGGPSVTEMMVQEVGNPDTQITLENYEAQVDALMEIEDAFHNKVVNEGYGFVYEAGGMKME